MDYSILQIFSCPAYSLVDSQKRNELESKSKKCIFIGFTKGVKSFRLGIPRKGAPLPAEMWSLTKIQCCEKSQRWRIKRKMDLQIVRQQQEKGVEFSDSPKRPERSEENSSDSDGGK